MKRVLKRILPILLTIVLILSIAWYLFVYDREFTRDMLVGQARYFDSKGNYALASWLYELAYRQADEDESVAIELAQKFVEQGNYTQAEKTLSGAIADGGSAELYIALCNIYVEQNKLLDAVTMLDNITDPVVKAQLEEKRPKAPAVSHEPGFYNEYITVELRAASGALYVTTDGTYPSKNDAASDGIVTLRAGDNTIYALVLGDNGLVSPLAVYGYTVGGVIEQVTIQDPTVDQAVRQALDIDAGQQLTSDMLWAITDLTLPTGVASYADLKYLPYLESLSINGSSAESTEGIESLTHLQKLSFTDCILGNKDLERIATLPVLTHLTLAECRLSNIQGLSGCKSLTMLDLSGNSIQDLSALSFMTGLTELYLEHNALVSLNAISNLSSLKILDVSYNSLVSVAPLSGCTALEKLYVGNNAITDLSCAGNWTKLTVLSAGFNQLADITALTGCTSLQELDISHNLLTDISILSNASSLQILNFSNNQVTTLPAFTKGSVLVNIDGSNNLLETLASLSGLSKLNNVTMDYNKISSVEPLASCHNLIKVSVYGNPVKDVSALTEMNVIVVYSPDVKTSG